MPKQAARPLVSISDRFFSFCRTVELPRKIWHASSIGGTAYLSYILDDYVTRFLIVLGCLLIALLFEWGKTKVSIPFIHHLQREGEKKGECRTTVIDFIAGLAICVTIFPQSVVTVALLITAFCDPAAAFVGQASYVKTRWRNSKKCVEGSLVCAGVAFLIAGMWYKMQFWPLLLLTGIVCAYAELKSKQKRIKSGWFKDHLTPADNFYIMIAASLCLITVEGAQLHFN